MADWQTAKEAGYSELEAYEQALKDIPVGAELQKLKRRKGYTAHSIGFRQQKGRRKREVVIRLYVERKMQEHELRSNQKLPVCFGDGPVRTPVDVVELGKYENCMAKASPSFPKLETGALIGPDVSGGGWGTLGLVVVTRIKREPRLLTNAHVVIGGGNITTVRHNGQNMLQPPARTRLPSTRARLAGALVKSTLTLNGTIDAALVTPAPSIPAAQVGNNGSLTHASLTELDLLARSRVSAYGAASALASSSPRGGRVDSLQFETTASGVTFREQILVEPDDTTFLIQGDSGSALVKGTQVVGLVHGRVELTSDSGVKKWYGVACPIEAVLDSFKVDLP